MADDFYFSAFFYFGSIFAESSGFPIFVINFQPTGEGADISNGGGDFADVLGFKTVFLVMLRIDVQERAQEQNEKNGEYGKNRDEDVVVVRNQRQYRAYGSGNGKVQKEHCRRVDFDNETDKGDDEKDNPGRHMIFLKCLSNNFKPI